MLVAVIILAILVVLLGWGLYKERISEYYTEYLEGSTKGYGMEVWVELKDFTYQLVRLVCILIYYPVMWFMLLPTVIKEDINTRFHK